MASLLYGPLYGSLYPCYFGKPQTMVATFEWLITCVAAFVAP